MTRIWKFPNVPVRLVLSSVVQGSKKVDFVVPQSMSKPDLKVYLEKIYSLPVQDINSMNYMGKTQRTMGGKKYYQRSDFKKAVVTLQEPVQLSDEEVAALDVALGKSSDEASSPASGTSA